MSNFNVMRWCVCIWVCGALVLGACGDDGENPEPPLDQEVTSSDVVTDVAVDVANPPVDDVADQPETELDAGPEVVPMPDVVEPDDSTVPEPDVVPEPLEKICMEYMDCVFDACDDLDGNDVAAATDCVTAAIESCGSGSAEDGGSEGEADVAATALATCMAENSCPMGESQEHYECWRNNCLAETGACVASESGSTPCILLGGCMAGCKNFMGGWDWHCVKDCMDGGTENGVLQFWDRQLCGQGYCFDDIDPVVCTQSVYDNPGKCGNQNTACGDDT